METFDITGPQAGSFSIVQLLVVVLFIFIIAEWLIARLLRIRIHDLRDTLRNIFTGVIGFLFDTGFSVLTFPLLAWLYDHCRIFIFDGSRPAMLLLFVLVDLMEYWFHRLSHEVNLLWSAHVVHHQSEHFNLFVGFRTSVLVPVFNSSFYLVFPVLGFNPADVLLVIFIQGIYQLLVHTKLVGKLGALEYILVTPSAHRVHHGKNEMYIDKNYGKVLIIWDRLFGTYCEETEEVQYGITAPLKRNGVLYSMFEPVRMLVKLFVKAKRFDKRVAVLFRKPAAVEEMIK